MNRRLTVAGVAAILLLVLVAAILLNGGHSGVNSPSPSGGGQGRGLNSPSPSGGLNLPSPARGGGQGGGATSPTSSPASTPAPPPPPPPYVFNPQPSASGSSPATHFLAGDLTLPAGQQVVAILNVSGAGSVSLHAFPEGSSSYPIGSLQACLEFTGQAACSPAPFPNPAYWTVSANDLAQHQSYRLRVVGIAAPGGQLVGMDFGWNGAHHITLSGIDLPGGCSGATGYTPGCGIRFKVAAGPGNLGVAVAPGVEIHLKVQDKSSGTVACDVRFVGSTGCTLPSYATWSGHLYPQTGQAVNPATLSVNWP
jgi:hypothetical protein